MQENLTERLSENLFAVKLLGFWTPTHKLYSKLYAVYNRIFFGVFIIPVPIAAILYFVFKENVEVIEVTDSAYIISELTAYVFRMFQWIKYEQLIKDIVSTVQNETCNMPTTDRKGFLDDVSKTANNIFRFYIICCTIALFAWASVPFFAENRILPLQLWYPFDPLKPDGIYIAVYVHLFLWCTVINVSTSTLVAGLMLHTTGQIRILKNSFVEIGELAEILYKMHNPDEVDTIISKRVITSIQHHQRIILFVSKIEVAFSMFSFAQFLAGSFIICTTAFELSIISPFAFKFYWMFIYMVCMLLELLLFCWFSTDMHYESASLTDAIYTSQWYIYGPKSKKLLTILMERAKRPLRVRAANIIDLSLDTFSTILRRAYSLFAVLQHLNSNKY